MTQSKCKTKKREEQAGQPEEYLRERARARELARKTELTKKRARLSLSLSLSLTLVAAYNALPRAYRYIYPHTDTRERARWRDGVRARASERQTRGCRDRRLERAREKERERRASRISAEPAERCRCGAWRRARISAPAVASRPPRCTFAGGYARRALIKAAGYPFVSTLTLRASALLLLLSVNRITNRI